MIPKRIIYCWFGGKPLGEMERACVESWKEHCPDYEIVRIDEKSFDVNSNPFAKEAYENGNYSFVSDVARLEALKKLGGGFYLDTDIMLVGSLEPLRPYEGVVACNGKGFYNSAPLACGPKFPELFAETLATLTFGKCINTLLNQLAHERYDLHGAELEVADAIAFVGSDWFLTPGYCATGNTIGIHFCHGSWLDKWQGGYDKKSTFIPFLINQNGVNDANAKKRYFGDAKPIAIMETEGRPFSADMVFYGNYLYNKRVLGVSGKGFRLTRIGSAYPTKSMKVEDVTLWLA